MLNHSANFIMHFSAAKKSRSQNAVNPHSAELYCDDDISLKERLQRAEAVSQ